MSFTIVDDRDTDRIQYVGNWELTGNATRTLSQAADRGLNASFRFNGDYVAVFGTTLPPPFGVVQTIRMEYQVDERDPIIRVWNSTKINAPYETSSLWFSSWIPSDREHTLSIRYLEGDTGFLFDYIEYREALVISTSFNTTSFPTSTLTPAEPYASFNRVLTITLSVVLGSIFVAILCLCFYFSRANRRAKRPTPELINSLSGNLMTNQWPSSPNGTMLRISNLMTSKGQRI
ncbi:hypothetical protein BKA70DRAFT_367566 [Coprinopsis sp. MPI-PUGE-AT-0042]|nr:hypothetical protein BKA70DRAFT_367566 [Coprinopsis sp. MPI-PUGE-AT-0042]